MSAFDEEISNVGGSDRRGSQGDDDNDDADDDGKKRHTTHGFRKDIGKAKQVVLQQFTKAKKQLHNRRHKKTLRSSSGSVPAIATRASGKTIRGGSLPGGCYFCFTHPQVVESPNESPSRDPNDPTSTYAMLKTLIEKNDFYAKECNPHLD